ncbi:MAG: glycine reductase [Pseudomonadota bacterium]
MDPLDYIPRIRSYYQALGYGAPYVWARVRPVPFEPLAQPLSRARVGIITTAAPVRPGAGDQRAGSPVNGRAKFFDVVSCPMVPLPKLAINHVAYDAANVVTDDDGAWFPGRALAAAAASGRVGSAAPRVICVPTNRSQTRTRDDYAPQVTKLAREDRIDAAVLVPICPVCHQTMALVAQHLEEAGIATVLLGAARDIVVHVGAPRLAFSNMPLGAPAGPPGDPDMQAQVFETALALLESATEPAAEARSPAEWPDPTWQDAYANAATLDADEIAARRAAFEQVKADGKKAPPAV